MNADDHAVIDFHAGVDHHRAAIFQVEQGVGRCLTVIVGDQDAVHAAADLALVGLIIVEQPVHDGRAARVGQKLRLIADQAARGRVEDEALAVAARGAQLDHLGLALRHLLHDDAGMLLVHVDDHFLDGLEKLAAFVLLHHHAGARYGELEALSAHGFDENGELEFATA